MKRFLSSKINLRVKFILFFILTALLPLLTAMFVTRFYMQGIEKENATILNKQIAQGVTEEIKAYILEKFGIIDNISKTHEYIKKEDFGLLFDTTISKNESFTELILLDHEGQEVNRRHEVKIFPKSELENRSQRDDFLTIKQKGRYLGPIYFVGGRPYFEIGIEIRHFDGTFEGAVLAIIDARVMQDVVSRISSLSTKGQTYIVDSKGNLIAHPDLSQVLAKKNYSRIPALQTQGIDPSIPYLNELKEEVIGASLPIVVNFQQKQNTPLDTGWVVVVEQPTSIAFAAVYQIARITSIILIIVVLAAVILMFVFGGRIVSPIEQLHIAVRQFGAGNLDQRVIIKTRDEIEDLANSFNAMAAQIKKQIEDLKQVDKLKDEFIGLVSHNLRTPLTEIQGCIHLMKTQHSLPESLLKYLTRVSENVSDLNKLVEEILYITTINTSVPYFKFEPVNLISVIQNALKAVEVQSKNKQVILKLFAVDNLPQVNIDQRRIQDVIVNLLDNAIKFSHQNGQVEISVKSEGGYVVAAIADHGVGMDKEALQSLFQKFHRGTSYLEYDYQGIGLGLYYSKLVLRSHKGSIWANSIKGVGSCFQLALPIHSIARLPIQPQSAS